MAGRNGLPLLPALLLDFRSVDRLQLQEGVCLPFALANTDEQQLKLDETKSATGHQDHSVLL